MLVKGLLFVGLWRLLLFFTLQQQNPYWNALFWPNFSGMHDFHWNNTLALAITGFKRGLRIPSYKLSKIRAGIFVAIKNFCLSGRSPAAGPASHALSTTRPRALILGPTRCLADLFWRKVEWRSKTRRGVLPLSRASLAAKARPAASAPRPANDVAP